MIRPSTTIRRATGPLLLGVVAAALTGAGVVAVDDDPIDPDVPGTLEPPTTTEPPETTEPADGPATVSLPSDPGQQAPGPASDTTVRVEAFCDGLAGVVAYSFSNVRSGGPSRTYVVTLTEQSTGFGGDETRSKTYRNVADGGSVGGGFRGVSAGNYRLEVAPGDLQPLVFGVTVDDCAEQAPTTEPAPTTPETSEADAPAGSSAPGNDDVAGVPAGDIPSQPPPQVAGSPVFLFADPDTPVGESTLVRTDDALLATLWLGSRPPSEAITLWWVVFNEPDNCSAPGCGEDDLFIGGNPAQGSNDDQIVAAAVGVGYAAGTIVADDGTGFLVARLDTGRRDVDVIIGDDSDGLLTDADSAEVHLVARSHGPAIAGLEAIQTTSYTGGCDTMLDPPAQPEAPGECADVAFSIHRS